MKNRKFLVAGLALIALILVGIVVLLYSVNQSNVVQPITASQYHTASPTVNSATVTPTVKPANPDDDVREAIFRQLIQSHAQEPGNTINVYCLSFLEGGQDPSDTTAAQDPSDEFMARFKDSSGIVKKYSDCGTLHDMLQVYDKATGAFAIIFSVGNITWINQSQVQVYATYRQDGIMAAGSIYTLEKQNGQWVITKETLKWTA